MKHVISVALALLMSSSMTPGQEKVFRAGAHAQDITPQRFPISVNGGMADRQISVVNDRLHARCLVLDDGETTLAFAVCDSCMIPREITDRAKKLVHDKIGLPPSRILISATHTHSAPTVTGVFQSEPDAVYQQYLGTQIAEGIITAHKKRVPAQIGWGSGQNAEQVFNRRWHMKEGGILQNPFGHFDKVRMNPGYDKLNKPAGPIDPEIGILSVRTTDGKPLALLANYSLHYVGGFPNLSADYFGAFAERIKTLVGGDDNFVGILSNGTSGDINNVNFAKGPAKYAPGERIREVSESVAQSTLKGLKAIEHRKWVKLDSAMKELTLGVRRPNRDDLARANQILAAAKGAAVLKTQVEIYARESLLLDNYADTVDSLIQTLRIGDLGIAAIPCETFVEIGLEIKKKSPMKQTFTISLANGYNGYLPTPEQHALGGYETWRARSSYLEVDASPKISRAIFELFDKVAR